MKRGAIFRHDSLTLFRTRVGPAISRQRHVIRCSSVELNEADLSGKKILIVGGTGRVGSSTASALRKNVQNLEVCVAGRSQESYSEMLDRRKDLEGVAFKRLDVNDSGSLKSAMEGMDLVIHTAGPFQQTTGCPVLEAAIETSTPYLDVCDDTGYAKRAKEFHEKAKAVGVPAITTGGIYPGISNVIAAHMISKTRGEYDEQGLHKEADEDALAIDRLRYSYFTAGSGGVGETLIVTSYMLLGEPVIAFQDGKEIEMAPLSQRVNANFGAGVGRQGVYLFNLPEVYTTHKTFGIPNVSARFGTSPDLFNWLMLLIARLVPQSVLQNRSSMEALAKLSGPFIKAADSIVGEKVAMRIDVEFEKEKFSSGVFYHPKMSESVGICTAALARCILAGGTEPGVWYPEEKGAISHRRSVLVMASEGCMNLVLNKAPWAIDSNPEKLGIGFYIY